MTEWVKQNWLVPIEQDFSSHYATISNCSLKNHKVDKSVLSWYTRYRPIHSVDTWTDKCHGWSVSNALADDLGGFDSIGKDHQVSGLGSADQIC